MPRQAVLLCLALCGAILYCIVLYRVVFCCLALRCPWLYCTALCYIVLYCTALYCTVPHCAILCRNQCCSVTHYITKCRAVLRCSAVPCTTYRVSFVRSGFACLHPKSVQCIGKLIWQFPFKPKLTTNLHPHEKQHQSCETGKQEPDDTETCIT